MCIRDRNKGREMNMVMISNCGPRRNAPVAEALAASDLQGAQEPGSDARTRARAKWAVEPAEGESHIFLRTQREHAASSPSAPIHSAQKKTCAIYAKALEEAHGREAAFPGHRLCNWTRLVWECFSFKSKCGRLLHTLSFNTRAQGYGHEFKKVWVDRCGYLNFEYDRWLCKLPEPTEAKWGIMYDVCFPLLNLFDVAPHRARVGKTRFEEFLEACLELLRGTSNPNRPPQDAGKPPFPPLAALHSLFFVSCALHARLRALFGLCAQASMAAGLRSS
eukprot:142437-Pleurochrysis_carterae.AAC.2